MKLSPAKSNVFSSPVISDVGYVTACVGKWHLGLGFVRKENSKGKQDFDYSKRLTDGAHTRGFDFSFIILFLIFSTCSQSTD